MIEDHGDDVQREDLIGDDVAGDLAAAMNDGQPAKPSDNAGQVQTQDEPATDQNPTQPPSRPPITPTSGSDAGTNDKVNVDELHGIKQQALQQLGPLVEHIDQEPEERFETLMMMIRASDDASLVQPAHEAAQQITDDTKKARALLDIVNEVNYLTRPQGEETGGEETAENG